VRPSPVYCGCAGPGLPAVSKELKKGSADLLILALLRRVTVRIRASYREPCTAWSIGVTRRRGDP
jgi:hypothetical protein